jgi:hypothetical protein
MSTLFESEKLHGTIPEHQHNRYNPPAAVTKVAVPHDAVAPVASTVKARPACGNFGIANVVVLQPVPFQASLALATLFVRLYSG